MAPAHRGQLIGRGSLFFHYTTGRTLAAAFATGEAAPNEVHHRAGVQVLRGAQFVHKLVLRALQYRSRDVIRLLATVKPSRAVVGVCVYTPNRWNAKICENRLESEQYATFYNYSAEHTKEAAHRK